MDPRLPRWLKVRIPGGGRYYDVRKRLGRLKLPTVCEEARCPNVAECWGGGTATFMVLGKVCTRACRFCDVTSGRPAAPPQDDEPARLAEAVETMGLRYVVITSVDRDDLDDGGAAHFLRVVDAVRRRTPGVTIELLTPDFQGDAAAIDAVAGAGVEVLGHNVETVERLSREVRDRRCRYDLSLRVLARYRTRSAAAVVKSSLLLGLGEQPEEVLTTMNDLHRAGVDWVTLGQYLRPTRKHAPVKHFVPPEQFERYAAAAREIGFALVSAGPLVRSSYRAAESEAAALYRSRTAAS